MPRNDAGTPEQIVLSDALTRVVGDRRVTAAVFTTFEFEPDFFELHVLPCLFPNVAWSHMPNVKRVQVGEALVGLEHVAVFYDRRGLRPEGGVARLDYERIGLTRAAGVFHAKNILLLVESSADDGKPCQCLVVATTSANLTRSGWHENLEVAQVLEIKSGEPSAVRDDMLHKRGLLSVLEDAAPGGSTSDAKSQVAAAAVIREFLLKQTESPVHRKHGGRLRPRLYVGREKFAEFLRVAGRIDPNEYCLEIISPFFENTAEALTVRALLDAVQPAETRIYSPLANDGTARCSREFFQAVKDMHNVHWASLPSDMTRWSRKGDKTKHRNVHAKVYRLFKGGRAKDDWRDVQIVGSVNLTGAAHAGGTVRNFETAILLDLECQHRPDWWMTPLDKPAAEFDPCLPEDDAGSLACHELTLRFHWQSDPSKERLDYFWKAEPSPPQCASIWANGCRLFAFGKIVFDRWEPLDDDARQAIQQRLRTSSLVELLVESVPDQKSSASMQPLLVQEINMAQKPPLLEGLSAAEILEYWSLLTPDQRNEYLERKLTALLERAEKQHDTMTLPEPSESLFDRFAGIFHAFSCLEEHVLEALKRGAEKDARYRLIGTSYDSLPTLANQVKDSADAVVAYVTLLRAGEVFRRLRGQIRRQGIQTDFLEKPDVKEACRRYEREWQQACQVSKGRIAAGGPSVPDGFFDWYERAFTGSVRVADD